MFTDSKYFHFQYQPSGNQQAVWCIQLDEVKKFMYMEAYHIMGLLHYFLLKAQVVPGVLRSQ